MSAVQVEFESSVFSCSFVCFVFVYKNKTKKVFNMYKTICFCIVALICLCESVKTKLYEMIMYLFVCMENRKKKGYGGKYTE